MAPSQKVRSIVHAVSNSVPLQASGLCGWLASEKDRDQLIGTLGHGGRHDNKNYADAGKVNLPVGMRDSGGIVSQARTV